MRAETMGSSILVRHRKNIPEQGISESDSPRLHRNRDGSTAKLGVSAAIGFCAGEEQTPPPRCLQK
jgi:hypothetical protein